VNAPGHKRGRVVPTASAALVRPSMIALSRAALALDHPAKVTAKPGSASAALARRSVSSRLAFVARQSG
jgi:hypothetical protein